MKAHWLALVLVIVSSGRTNAGPKCLSAPRMAVHSSWNKPLGTVYLATPAFVGFESYACVAATDGAKTHYVQFRCGNKGLKLIQFLSSKSSYQDPKLCTIRLKGRYAKGDFSAQKDSEFLMTPAECKQWVRFRDTTLAKGLRLTGKDSVSDVIRLGKQADEVRGVWQKLASQTELLRKQGKLEKAWDLGTRMIELAVDRLMDLGGLLRLTPLARVAGGAYTALKCQVKAAAAGSSAKEATEFWTCIAAIAASQSVGTSIFFSTASMGKAFMDAAKSQDGYEKALDRLDRAHKTILKRLDRLASEIGNGKFAARTVREVNKLKSHIDKMCAAHNASK